MAADIGKRKRKKYFNRPKLLVDDQVEVRSVEEGFQGSWHSGIVIACENRARRIQYDNVLCDDGSRCLIEGIKVPPIIDGIIPASRDFCNYRGLIRPLRPPCNFHKCSIHYGQCVDVYHEEAWWEGVIFDHEDGSEEWTVFFPDMGDEMRCGVDKLRITYDWDEFTEEWKPRGNWLFLELVEEIEQDWPLHVSLRQIWYEVRGRKDFRRLEEWTSTNRSIWKDLVWKVVVDNCRLTIHQFFQELESSGELALEALPPFSETNVADKLRAESESSDSLTVIASENDAMDSRLLQTDQGNATVPPVSEEMNLDGFASVKEDGRLDTYLLTSSNMPCHEETPCLPPPAQPVLPVNADEFSGMYSNLNSKGFLSPSSGTPGRKFRCQRKRKHLWKRAGLDIIPRAEFCPDSVNEFSKNKRSESLRLNFRMHLAYLGWKIEYVRDGLTLRMRYTSPDGKFYYSLVKVCEALMEPALEIVPFSSQANKRIPAAGSESPFSPPLSEPPHARMEDSVIPPPPDIVVESEYCPQAVVAYAETKDKHVNSGVKDLQLKAKKHLSAIGWSFWYTMKGVMKRELRYSSPSGRCYNSLRAACKGYIHEGGVHGNKETRCQLAGKRFSLALTDTESHEDWTTRSAGVSWSRELVELLKPPVKEIKKSRRKPFSSYLFKRNHPNASSQMLKKGKTSKSLVKLRDDLGSDCPMRVLRSSKRARQGVASSSSYQNARTVLSWLIDNNVVLPRAKVRYISRKDNHPMAEGRITRDGIRCTCCQNVFTLSKFEVHAGSTCHRPAAHIFLEDGRSLLDCQSELKSHNIKKNLMTEPHERRRHDTNDYICTACHFGGELVLCDRCPSSFHTSCLGLKDVPDGDWFCPSCCCGICGRSRLNKDPGHFTDDSVLSCDQCEHQYHVGCLRKRGVANVDKYPKGNWFCSKRCEKICLGLHKLLGKPVSVGIDNLTWTLLKYIKYDDDDHDGPDAEALMESYSKLNVALSVMHECFEPVKEPGTGRDLVEDVLFSRWSELNRLNFRGFYTVLLERNDELITAATVRVHGEKVAEVPLVGTRFKYRRLGMCRILMNELEKKLMELGVERLVLPAVPNVLNTWTTSFGFSKMTRMERLNFVGYTFLDFQGTVMCQKLLRKIPSTDLRLIIRTQQNIHDVDSGSDNMDLDGNSAISEAFQEDKVDFTNSAISEAFQEDKVEEKEDKVEESEIVDQEPADVAGDNGSDGDSSTAPPGFEVNQPNLECMPWQNGKKECKNGDNGIFKCYKRRRISTCGS